MPITELYPLQPINSFQERSVNYSPSSIVAIFNAATIIKEEKKIIQVRGIFKKVGTSNYGGNFYNRLKDETGENSITLITSALMHNKLEDNKTIEFNGYITRRVDKQGRIELLINFIELISQQVNIFSEEDTNKILLINKKVETGFKDLDAVIKDAIFNKRKLSIKVIMGKSGIIDSDIKDAMEIAISLYDIEFHRVSLSAPKEIINKIISLDDGNADLICVARGGGENLSTFENAELCEAILNRNTIIASAIGHAQDVTLFEKLSDKKFITPTQFGNYLKEIYNSTIEELENSKAKLVKDITEQLAANYSKQILNLQEQVAAAKELHDKTLIETSKNHSDQIKLFQDKLISFEQLSVKAKDDSEKNYKAELTQLKNQISDLNTNHQSQLIQLEQLRIERINSLNEQVEALKQQQLQNEKIIFQSNNIAENYLKEINSLKLKSSPTLLYIIISVVLGLLIGWLIWSSK